MATIDEAVAILESIQTLVREIPTSVKINPNQILANALSEISTDLGLFQAGEFRSGNRLEPGKGFSGLRMTYPAIPYSLGSDETWNLAGFDNDVLKTGINAQTGLLYATDATIEGTITADDGFIGGWTIDTNELYSASFHINSLIPAILMGSATDYLTGAGVFLGQSSSAYKMHIGDPAGKYLAWDGSSALAALGNWIGAAGVDFSMPTVSGLTITDNSPIAGKVAWTAFTLTYQGVSYSVTSGNSDKKYIYWKKSVSTTVLQESNTVPAQASDTFLVILNSSGTGTQSNFASFIYADYISVTNLQAISANMGNLTIDGKLTMSGASSAIAIGTTPPTSASAGTGIWLDRTGLYGLNSNEVEFFLDASTGMGVFGGGNATLGVEGVGFSAVGLFEQFDAIDTGAGSVWVRELIAPGTVYEGWFTATSELTVSNPGFETGDLTNWTTYMGSPAASSAQKHSGTYSVKCAVGDGIHTSHISVSGTACLVDFWMYVASGETGPYVAVYCYSGADAYLGTAYTNSTFITPPDGTGGKWAKFRFVFIYRTGTAKIDIYLAGNTLGAARDVYFDDIVAFDGDGHDLEINDSQYVYSGDFILSRGNLDVQTGELYVYGNVGIGAAPTGAYKVEITGSVMAGNVRTGSATMLDDTATNFVPPLGTGIIIVGCISAGDYYVGGYNGGGAMTDYLVGANAVSGTAVLTDGTSNGTDGKLCVNCNSNGNIYIKNRRGGTRYVHWLCI